MKNLLLKILISIIILISINSCNLFKDPLEPENNSYKIEIGAFSTPISKDLGTNGGSIIINEGDIKGLTVSVPKNGLKNKKTFSFSSAPITNNPDKENLNIITPIIRIDNGGGYADSVMKITIPCVVPKDHFAMGFYYDIETQELEGIPVVAINDDNIVLATRHFSGKALGKAKVGFTKGINNWADLIVASIPKNKLFDTQESGFRPGIDDWEFPNYGSYIAKNGHCTGQSVTAMWYYTTQKLEKNEPQLYGRFEKIPGKLWQDNRNGFRFASVVWADQTAGKRAAWMAKFNSEGTKRFGHDSLHFLSFAYSIHLTKKPQLVEVWHNTGGHAMIVYKTSNGLLSIADPNFPSTYNHLVTLNSNGRFSPYESKSSADDPSTFYPEITYVAKSALFNFESIGARYEEMKKGTIGDFPPNQFPSVELMYLKGKDWVSIPDTFSTDLDSITVGARCVGCAYGWQGNMTLVEQYNKDGALIAQSRDGLLKIKVESGENLIPFYIRGTPDNIKWRFIDFKMPLVKKEKVAKFEYWLKNDNPEGWGGHFGQMADEESDIYGFPGFWVGNTYVINKILTVEGVSLDVKFTSTFNSDKTIMTSYKLDEKYTFEGESVRSTIEGSNLPKTATTSEYFVYGANGVSTCNYISNVYFNIFIDVEKYGCDAESFIKFRIPKP
ncbi:hypothetical protein EGI22_04655 [Lacihabitans sp. LS3-19]|uniref:hypothetical protein n=1 Tax=Lacihabitans sp. LS3-19 TaxID=2487335 RepID=UPI0020CF516B|nr:hypothetical protein [Lacihabitans sp. LS3-19]MCP9767189.1 hypothetical protein [Lacihabitans sp. LS3-19]